jgi:hypothetical protein
MTRQTKRVVATALGTVVVLGAAFALMVILAPYFNRPTYIEGRPLLLQDGPYFTDDQVGFQFTPPPGWGMQARSTESPTTHKPERMVVKYKRLVRGPKVAWLRVSVADAASDAKPEDLLRTRKPREISWVLTKEVESGLTIGGRPAARVTFGGMMNPDSSGSRHCTAEVFAVVVVDRVIYFTGTFTTSDNEARQQLRTSIESAVFQ